MELAERRVVLLNAGKEYLEEAIDPESIPFESPRAREELVTQALSALHLFHRDQHYGQSIII